MLGRAATRTSPPPALPSQVMRREAPEVEERMQQIITARGTDPSLAMGELRRVRAQRVLRGAYAGCGLRHTAAGYQLAAAPKPST